MSKDCKDSNDDTNIKESKVKKRRFWSWTKNKAEQPLQTIKSEKEQLANNKVDKTILSIDPSEPNHSIDIENSINIHEDEKQTKKKPLFNKLFSSLGKTRTKIMQGVSHLFIGAKEIDETLLEELEAQMLSADFGIETTNRIMNSLTEKIKYRELNDSDALFSTLKKELLTIIRPAEKSLLVNKKPYVILVVGVNGVGKTTTIGKLAQRLKSENKSVMLAAGDTFRAAAIEQLKQWGHSNDVPVIGQSIGSDSASVIYDAFVSAKSKNVDVLIADTAGRLHNKSNLMEELKKIKRVLNKIDQDAPNEIVLVIDASTGQNALSQVQLFNDCIPIDSFIVTKLDGTAKGGIMFALIEKFNIPIRFIGIGEKAEDLIPFNAESFVEALFD